MKTIINFVMAVAMLLSFSACSAQINNSKTALVNIDGNCSMCEKTIESSGNLKKTVKVDWDKESKMAEIEFDSTQTNLSEILKRIAVSGYDNEQFLAPDEEYAKLPDCCKYDRIKKSDLIEESTREEEEVVAEHNHDDMVENETIDESAIPPTPQKNQLNAIFNHYFDLKDALVQSDRNETAAAAVKMTTAINAIKMQTLTTQEHNVWMEIEKALTADAGQISAAKDIASQRDHFMRLSDNIYKLMKVSTLEEPAYYQFCPMANDGEGANWVSQENVVKNPYYGAQMLSCGKVVETIK
jgi:copper chaperone CopZ